MDKLNVGLAAGVKGMIVNLFNIPRRRAAE